MTSKNVYVISAVIFVLGFIAGGVTLSALRFFHETATAPYSGGCTQEAMICPDGSAVGRIGPNCEFAECPAIPPDPTYDNGITVVEPDPSYGVVCARDIRMCSDGSSVVRIGPRCEFAECPPILGQGSVCRSDSDCGIGYTCLDPSPVVRGGESNLRCWKKGMPTPICLSGDTRIETPNGDVSVKDIKKGMSVWTVDRTGKKIAAVVALTGKVFAPPGHKVAHIQLSDHRDIYVSPGHKVADGRKAGDLHAGDILQGATILSVNFIPYTEEYTYDILPEGETGFYFANGILLQSTIHEP